MKINILQSKLNPPFSHPDLVQRERLTNQIENGIRQGHKLCLIAAPAGFGKSTTACVWAAQNKHKTAWLSLDGSENETFVFWNYLLAAIEKTHPGFGESISFSTETMSAASPEDFAVELLNEFDAIQEITNLVLDDFHLIENPQIHQGIAFLLQNSPANLHLIMATRVDPQLPLARLRGRRQLTEIRADDLRFTEEESENFLNQTMRLNLTPADLKILNQRTEGWAVGMLLAAQSIQGKENKHKFIRELSGSQRFILDYLAEEVLTLQPENIRQFLLKTSILERFNPRLCSAVCAEENTAALLTHLEKQNLFLIALDELQWYRYHHLFADLLKNFLYAEYSNEHIQQLYQLTSEWFAAEGQPEEAVHYALKGKLFQQAAGLMEEVIEQLIAQGRVQTLINWLSQFPEEIINQHPRLLLHHGWIIFLSGDVKTASLILKNAKQAVQALPEGSEKKLLHGKLYALLATLDMLTREIPKAMKKAQAALEHLPTEEVIFRARAKRALGVGHLFRGEMQAALQNLEEAKTLALKGKNLFLCGETLSQIATIYKHQGDLEQAAAAYRGILALYEKPEQTPPACLAYIGLAEIFLERFDLEQAQEYLNTGIRLCCKANIGYAMQPACLLNGVLKQLTGDQTGAQMEIEKGHDLSRRGGGSLESIFGLAKLQTRWLLLQNKIDEAADWAHGKRLPEGWHFADLPPVLFEAHQSLLALVALRSGDFETVLKINDLITQNAAEHGRSARVLELSIYKAAALQGIGNSPAADEAFQQCLDLAAPQGYTLLFIEAGDLIHPLLQRANQKKTHLDHISKLMALLLNESPSGPDQSALVEKLTERELQVLQLMCQGFSNQKIANQMIVSINTIKKHTSNIYAKLGVQNRAQAVIFAREKKLV